MKKYLNYILSFTIPILICLLGLCLNKIYPFGTKILLMLDGYNQYPGFLNSFIEVLKNHQSILYSFKGLTGFNLYAASIYYSFNITNIIFLFFKNIVKFYTFIIIFKIALSSLTMNTYLNYLKKDKYNFLFSICFSLTAYNLLYYLNYMWFDSVILLPLVILGIEKIFKENNYTFYTIFLTLSIIFNFYIGYMICIFSVIYFTYKWIMNNHQKEYLLKYLLYSLLAGLISACTIIPVVLELINGKGSIFATTEYFKFDLDFLNVFYKLTLGSLLNGDLEYGTPNVYVSIYIYLNVFMYFFNKNIKLKEKIINGIITIFFLLSMSFNLLDYFWQMLQMPIFYPVRYAFIFDFYLIYLAYQNYIHQDNLSLKKNIIILLLMIILISIGFITSGNLLDKVNIPAKSIYLGISILLLIYYLFIINNQKFKKAVVIVLIIELSINTFITFKNNGNINEISDFNNDYQENKTILNNIDYNYFEKISFSNRTIKNNGLLLNYNDLNYFSSVRNNKTFNLLNKGLGILTINDCNTRYYYNNPVVNALLNIKYFITNENIDYYNLVDTYENNNIYENEDITSIGFLTNIDITNIELTDDYMTNLNNLVKSINQNDQDIISEIPYEDKNVSCSEMVCIRYSDESYIKYSFKADKDSFIYIQNDYPVNKDETIYEININGTETTVSSEYPLKINKNDIIEINIKPVDDDFKDYFYHIYEIDYEIYQEFIKNINQEKLEITSYISDANFKGKITVNENTLLFTTISNDKGWKIYVDGKLQENLSILDGFIGIELTEGTHEITFKYFPPGLKIGLIISGSSLVIFTGLILYKRKMIEH